MKRNRVTAERKLAVARRCAAASYGLLLFMLSIRVFAIRELEPGARVVMGIIFIVPLLIFLPGMLRGNHKTFLWLCFVVLIYFMALTNNVFRPGAGLVDWLALGVTCVLFISAMLFARWKQRSPLTE